MVIDKEHAFEMFAKGMSVNAVASTLKTTWYIASQFKSAWLIKQAGENYPSVASAIGMREPNALIGPNPEFDSDPASDVTYPDTTEPASTALDDSVPEAWDITLSVPSERAADIFATFTTQEKFDAIGYVLQRRMDVALDA